MAADAHEILGWIEHIVELGIRRPGYPADDHATEWCRSFFHRLDLDDVRLEDVPLPRWEPHAQQLNVWRTPGDLFQPRCFPLPHAAPVPGGVEGPLVVVGSGDCSGAVALDTVTLTHLPQTLVRDRLAMRSYDPDGEFDTLTQVLPFGRQMQNVTGAAIDAGAAAFVGIFDAPWETCDYYVPYDGIQRPIPGVWVSRADGERLKTMLDAGPVNARITVDSTRETVVTHNVVGTLPGASDDWVIIGSHHDGPWTSAVEDASGVALVMAQAVYWSKVPERDRPHNMLFVVTSGHMVAGSGTAAFIEAHRDMLPSVVLELHLEHPARECTGVDGKLVPTDSPEVRWWFTSKSERLIDTVESAIRGEDLRRSFIMRPDAFGPHPTTDGGYFYSEGVPLVNFLTAPMYLFDAQDTIDKVHVPSLEPVTRAAIRIVEGTRGISAAEMRAGILTP
jgi:hypothetical protein